MRPRPTTGSGAIELPEFEALWKHLGGDETKVRLPWGSGTGVARS